MYILKEEKDFYVFKTLEEAEDFSKFLYDCEIYEKHISFFFNKYKCLTNEANFYLTEIKNGDEWEFKLISSNKSAIDLIIGQTRFIPLKLDSNIFVNENEIEDIENEIEDIENEIEDEIEDIYDLIYGLNENIIKIEESNRFTQKILIYSTTLFFVFNTLKLFF